MNDTSLIQDFIIETQEHLENLENKILKLDDQPDNKELINDIFRSVHTIKGSSEYLGLLKISDLSHRLENLLELIRHDKQTVSKDVTDVLIVSKDRMDKLLEEIETEQKEIADIDDVIKKIDLLSSGNISSVKSDLPEDQTPPEGITPSKDPDGGVDPSSNSLGIEGMDDNFKEDTDTELFDIFMGQLKEEVTALSTLATELYRFKEPEKLLNQFTERINLLKSSANYMGYEKLCAFYDRWLIDVSVSQKQVAQNQPIDVEVFIESSYTVYVNYLLDLFPRLDVDLTVRKPDDTLALTEEILLDDVIVETDEEKTEDTPELILEDEIFENLGTEVNAEADTSTGDMAVEKTDSKDEEELFPDLDDMMLDDASETKSEDEAKTENSEEESAKLLEQEFIDETEEHLLELDYSLLDLADTPDNKDLLNAIFRTIHTIKGSSEYLGFENIAHLTHKVESFLDLIRQENRPIDNEVVEILIHSKDVIEELVKNLGDVTQKPERYDELITSIDALFAQLQDQEAGESEAKSEETSEKTTLTIASIPLNADAANYWELYEEEADEELIGIFLEQLIQMTEGIHEDAENLKDAENIKKTQDIFLEHLDKLQSSANYMGYEKLFDEYEAWSEEIKTFLVDDDKKGEAVVADFIDRVIHPRLYRIRLLFDPEKDVLSILGEDRVDEQMIYEGPEEKVDVDDDLMAQFAGENESDELKEEALAPFNFLEEDQEVEVSNEEMGLYTKLESAFEQNVNHFGMAEEPLPETLDSETPLIDQDLNNQKEMKGVDLEEEAPDDFSIEKQLLSGVEPESDIVTLDMEEKGAESESGEAVEDKAADSEAKRESVDEPEPELEFKLTTDESIPDVFYEPGSEEMEAESNIQFAADLQDEAEEDSDPLGLLHRPSEDIPAESDAPLLPSDEALRRELPSFLTDAAQDQEKEVNPVFIERTEPEDKKESVSSKKSVAKQNIRVDATKIDQLMNQVGELVVNRSYFSQLNSEMRSIQQHLSQMKVAKKDLKSIKDFSFRLSEATVFLGRVVNELQEGVMRVRMLPISQLFNRYPRLVRDLTKGTDKKVDLNIIGEDTELDKMVIEKISDPLIHIIRNAVDHGIETMTEREKKGKKSAGTIRLEAYHESNNVVIEISDDGRGFNLEKIKEKALKNKLANSDDMRKLSEKELLNFVMMPGFSTADKITHTSGRGVGMDVVKKNIEKLNGTVELNFAKGTNTQIRIKIPLTLAIFPALLVYVGRDLFTIPLSSVEETLRIFIEEISIIEGIEVLNLRDEPIPLLRLSRLFHIDAPSDNEESVYVVVVNTGFKRVGLVVDSLVGQEEVVIKPLEDYLQENSGFSGATILGDGQISLILDVYELVNLSMEKQIRQQTHIPA